MLNSTTGGYNVLLTSGAGTRLTVPADGAWHMFYADGLGDVTSPLAGFSGVTTSSVTTSSVTTSSVTASGSGTFAGQLTGGGTTTDDNASAGQIGEFASATIPIAGGVATNTATDVGNIALTPGDWDVEGYIAVNMAPGATMVVLIGYINTVSDTLPSAPGPFGVNELQMTFPASSAQFLPVPRTRVSIASPTTVYLGIYSVNTGTVAFGGFISARRVR